MKTRREIILNNQKIKTKKIITKINTGIALFAAGAALNKVTLENPELVVHAQRNTPTQFLSLISDSASRIASNNDLYASVMIAQAALESGWGNSGLAQAPNYNLFGIKGEYNGNSITVDTLEDDGSGNYYQIQDGFRRYDDYSQSLQDYANVLTGNDDPNSWRYNYYQGARLSSTSSYQDATAHLTGRYATDTSYGSKLNKIIEQYGLTQYDSVESQASSSWTSAAGKGSASGPGSYVVQSGDSLYAIARKHGISIHTLLANTGLNINSTIHPGQLINVGVQVAGSAGASEYTDSVYQISQPGVTSDSQASSGSYTVQAGEGLYSIARRHGMTVSQLKSVNGLTNDLIHPGQLLKVSGSGVAETTNSSSTLTSTPVVESNPVENYTASGSGTYTVQAGEGLYRIAVKHGMTISQLKSLNGLSSDLIHAGQVLQVSGVANVEEVSPTAYVQETVETEVVEYQEMSSYSEEPSSSYTIQAGDTLYSIAKANGVNVHDLIARYGQNIHPGQVISLN